MIRQSKLKLFSETVSGLAVQLREWRYPVVFNLGTGETKFDDFRGHWSKQERFDEFLHAYTVGRATLEALAKTGHSVTEHSHGFFEINWGFPSVEPPDYLRRLNPHLYQQECERVQTRFDEAVQMVEIAFTEELNKMVEHLAERLTGGEDGTPKVFRDSAEQLELWLRVGESMRA